MHLTKYDLLIHQLKKCVLLWTSVCVPCQSGVLFFLQLIKVQDCYQQWGLDKWDTVRVESSIPLTLEMHFRTVRCMVFSFLVPSRPSHLYKDPIHTPSHLSSPHCTCRKLTRWSRLESISNADSLVSARRQKEPKAATLAKASISACQIWL